MAVRVRFDHDPTTGSWRPTLIEADWVVITFDMDDDIAEVFGPYTEKEANEFTEQLRIRLPHTRILITNIRDS